MIDLLQRTPDWALQVGGVVIVVGLFLVLPVRLGWISLHHRD